MKARGTVLAPPHGFIPDHRSPSPAHRTSNENDLRHVASCGDPEKSRATGSVFLGPGFCCPWWGARKLLLQPTRNVGARQVARNSSTDSGNFWCENNGEGSYTDNSREYESIEQTNEDLFSAIESSAFKFGRYDDIGGVSHGRHANRLVRLGRRWLGTTLAACSANTFNQVYEIKTDSLMKRTQGRPLPEGRYPRSMQSVGGSRRVLRVPLLTFGANPAALGVGVVCWCILLPLGWETSCCMLVYILP